MKFDCSQAAIRALEHILRILGNNPRIVYLTIARSPEGREPVAPFVGIGPAAS